MSGAKPLARTAQAVGWLMLAAGVAVFAIRLRHAGPYAFPEQGNLRAGVLALGIGIALAAPGVARAAGGAGALARRLLLAAAPIVLFFALYATLAEVEEVVVLRATDARGAPANLRLWVADHEGAAWVSMPRSKAERHSLDGARLELLRDGRTSCVVATALDRSRRQRAHVPPARREVRHPAARPPDRALRRRAERRNGDAAARSLSLAKLQRLAVSALRVGTGRPRRRSRCPGGVRTSSRRRR